MLLKQTSKIYSFLKPLKCYVLKATDKLKRATLMLRWFIIKYWMINQILFDMYNTQSKVVYKNENYLCSCYVFRANMMQCKHDICVNNSFDISKIGKCWFKRKNISQSSNKGNYNIPTIIKYKSMVSDVPDDEMFLHRKINNYNTTVNSNNLNNNDNTTVNRNDSNLVNDVKISNEFKFNELLPEE